jgi:predicted ATPase
MLNAMRVRNLRSFPDGEDLPFIDIRPITVLVGKNSSGKSSFLRTLPLLRQSVEAKTSGPILWYGSYVDFGAFSEAKKHNSSSDMIFFDLKIQLKYDDLISKRASEFVVFTRNFIRERGFDVEVKIGVSNYKNKTVAKIIDYEINNIRYSLVFEDDDQCHLLINGKEEPGLNNIGFLPSAGIMPTLGGFIPSEREIDGKRIRFKVFDSDYIEDYFIDLLTKKIKKFFHKKTSDTKIKEGLRSLWPGSKSDVSDDLKKIFFNHKTFLSYLNYEEIKDEIANFSHEYLMHKSISKIVANIGLELDRIFKGVRYIAPIRSTADRYYRHQDLRVDEIDHTGSNLAMLLRSLARKEQETFAKWTMENLGFAVRVEESGLHYSLKIQTEKAPREYNINDMGFGFSQILPIVVSIWKETFRRPRSGMERRKKLIFAIEQPELHLHPEYQARLARVLAKTVSYVNQNSECLKVVFETHSKTMIDALGDCIEEKIIPSSCVNVVIFDKNEENETNVRFSKFNSEGFLEDWPIGFFSGR